MAASAVGPRPLPPAPLLWHGQGCQGLFVSWTRESEATCLPGLQARDPGIEEHLHAQVVRPGTMPEPQCTRHGRYPKFRSHPRAEGRPLSPGGTTSPHTVHRAGGSMSLWRPSGPPECLVGSGFWTRHALASVAPQHEEKRTVGVREHLPTFPIGTVAPEAACVCGGAPWFRHLPAVGRGGIPHLAHPQFPHL